MVESKQGLGKGRIRASTEKLSGRVPEKGKISVSIEKWWNPGEYREKVQYVPLLNNCPDEFWKKIESVGVPENGRIRASTGKR